MQRAFGLNIPQTLEEVCDPNRLALIVYDMQVGIVKQIDHAKPVTDKVLRRPVRRTCGYFTLATCRYRKN